MKQAVNNDPQGDFTYVLARQYQVLGDKQLADAAFQRSKMLRQKFHERASYKFEEVRKTKCRFFLPRLRRLFLVAFCLVAAGAAFANGRYQVTSVAKDAHGVTLTLSTGVMRVEICTPTVIHVSVSPSSEIPDQLVPVVIHHWDPVSFRYTESGETLKIDTGRMQVKIARSSGRDLIRSTTLGRLF